MAIHSWSRVCQGNSDVWGYSDIGGQGYRVAIHGWFGDCQSNSGVQGYFDIKVYRSGNPCAFLDYQSKY